MKKTIQLILLVMLNNRAYSTVIVLLRNEKEIIVGADSRRSVLNKDLRFSHTDDSWCKIRQSGTFFYTLGGSNDRLQIYCADLAAKEAKSVEEFELTFGDNAIRQYNRYLTDMREKNPDEFSLRYTSRNNFAKVAVFRIENSVPQLRILTFFNEGNPDQAIKIAYTVEVNPSSAMIGFTREVFSMPENEKANILPFRNSNPALFIEKLIRYEENFHPTTIGGPIDIVHLIIDADKPKWIQRKPAC